MMYAHFPCLFEMVQYINGLLPIKQHAQLKYSFLSTSILHRFVLLEIEMLNYDYLLKQILKYLYLDHNT